MLLGSMVVIFAIGKKEQPLPAEAAQTESLPLPAVVEDPVPELVQTLSDSPIGLLSLFTVASVIGIAVYLFIYVAKHMKEPGQ